MTKLQTEKYLNKIIKHARVLYEEGKIYGSGRPIDIIGYFGHDAENRFSIQLFRGVRYIAETFDLPVGIIEGYTNDNLIWVDYEGCRFFELEAIE